MRAAVVVLAALIAAAAAGGAPTATKVSVFRPYLKGKLAPGLRIVHTAKGQCFAGSVADPRRDAWRCMVDNVIWDPCFSDTKVASWVLCPVDGTPFGKRVERLALSKALPRTRGNRGLPGQGNPWAIKLRGGKVCTFLTGATFAFHGKRVNYGCDRDTFLAGSPNRSKATWTITLGTGAKSKPRAAAILVAAW